MYRGYYVMLNKLVVIYWCKVFRRFIGVERKLGFDIVEYRGKMGRCYVMGIRYV